MEDFIQILINNKEILFSGLGVAVLGFIGNLLYKNNKNGIIKFITNNKTTINNKNTNNSNNMVTNNSHNTNKTNKIKNKRRNKKASINLGLNTFELINTRLYSTGIKGKVYTDNFHKAINHNFGIEFIIKNNTPTKKYVKIDWCIYNNNKKIGLIETRHKEIMPRKTQTVDLYITEKDFNNLKAGKYKSLLWINNKKIRKDFTITNK